MKIIKLILLFAFSFLVVFSLSFAQQGKRTAVILDTKGKVETKAPKEGWVSAKVGDVLSEGYVIRTVGSDSFALIKLEGKETSDVEIKKNSQLRLAELAEDKQKSTQSTMLDLALGDILIKAEKLQSDKSKFEVKTPTSIVGVRGTTFSVSVEAVQ